MQGPPPAGARKLALIAQLPLENARTVAFLGSKVLVAQNLAGMSQIDVSDPAMPRLEHHYPPEMIQPVHLAVEASVLYVADRFRGLAIWDMSNPDSPTTLSQTRVPGIALFLDLFQRGRARYAAVACGGEGVTLVEVTDPRVPRLIGRYTLDVDFSRQIKVRGNMGLVADNMSGGLKILDLRAPEQPQLFQKIALPGFCDAVTVGDRHVYCSYRTRGVAVFGLSGPGGDCNDTAFAPVLSLLCRFWRTNDSVRDILLTDRYAVVADHDHGLGLYGIQNPTMPVLEDEARTPSSAMSCAGRDGWVYVAAWDAGLMIYRLDGHGLPPQARQVPPPQGN